MTRRTIALVAAAAAALAFSSTASAQDRYADRAVPFTPGWAAPQLEVTPWSAVPGEPVQVSGPGMGGDEVRVYYGDQRMRVIRRGDDSVVAIIPRDARGDRFIYAVGDTGRARTIDRIDLNRQASYRDRDRYERSEHDRFDRDEWRDHRGARRFDDRDAWRFDDRDEYRRDYRDDDRRDYRDDDRRYRDDDRRLRGDLPRGERRDEDWLDALSDLF